MVGEAQQARLLPELLLCLRCLWPGRSPVCLSLFGGSHFALPALCVSQFDWCVRRGYRRRRRRCGQPRLSGALCAIFCCARELSSLRSLHSFRPPRAILRPSTARTKFRKLTRILRQNQCVTCALIRVKIQAAGSEVGACRNSRRRQLPSWLGCTRSNRRPLQPDRHQCSPRSSPSLPLWLHRHRRRRHCHQLNSTSSAPALQASKKPRRLAATALLVPPLVYLPTTTSSSSPVTASLWWAVVAEELPLPRHCRAGPARPGRPTHLMIFRDHRHHHQHGWTCFEKNNRRRLASNK